MSLASLYKSQVKSARAKVKSERDARERRRRDLSSKKKQLSELKKRLSQTRSDSQRENYERQIDTKSSLVDKAQEAFDRADEAVVKSEEKLDDYQQKLDKQEEADQKAAERRAKQDEKQRDRKARQAASEKAAREALQDAEIRQLHGRTSELEQRLLEAEKKVAPPEVTVLFLAASPQDEKKLRLDKETRQIQKRMRASEFRDSIFIEWRPARQLSDLIQDLNEVRPTILHFSGHGNSRALAFEDENEETALLTNDQLGKLLAAAPERIRLAIFNSCDSAAQAKLATAQVELAIGMDAPIEDQIAQTFAGEFYNSLGFGNSVGKAFEQAVFQIEIEHGTGHEIPRLIHADGVDPQTVALVNPDN